MERSHLFDCPTPFVDSDVGSFPEQQESKGSSSLLAPSPEGVETHNRYDDTDSTRQHGGIQSIVRWTARMIMGDTTSVFLGGSFSERPRSSNDVVIMALLLTKPSVNSILALLWTPVLKVVGQNTSCTRAACT
mmetsp:Transcript_7698/g.17740  ORF Transcript_7698/g.17740 Transcript_7698/m.17740 type:complete len:133 (+) Transcript_7698:438-836(+)|eukprot:CAMPEP_0116839588 /NCGR_PEP_ID=MMETSP0418-20121206/9853_1 /TAXON_ID=1158023 /ORGANISM="Astrosyne radiata, Strain 13vi08-1A" /LENGTH=132 /DNA_ID=CAMNT_0004469721 /DNA_START=525 /DNA_END=923 /DNA_ORIENTATION=+